MFRNCFLFALVVLVSYCFVDSRLAAAPRAASSDNVSYRLRLFNTHTGRRLEIVYRHGDVYDPDVLLRVDQFLRDRWTGAVHEYDPRVLDLLYDLTVALGRPGAEIDVICGYRTPRSNEYLRSHGHAVARHSLHMQAKAIDVRIPGVTTTRLRDAALALHRGGVGYYADSDFVHVDTGRVRRW